MKTLSLSIMPERLAICRLGPEQAVPESIFQGPFWSVTRTEDELSVVAPEGNLPSGGRTEKGWRGLKVAGPLDFNLTGILASLTIPLARAGIGVFALSTYDTDYILVRESDLERAMEALSASGGEEIFRETGYEITFERG